MGHGRSVAFVAVECASWPKHFSKASCLAMSEGHCRTRWTPEGLFEIADGGTIFLDEIAEISLGLQAKLLRVLQEQEIRPGRGTQPIQLDVRVIAAPIKMRRRWSKPNAFVRICSIA